LSMLKPEMRLLPRRVVADADADDRFDSINNDLVGAIPDAMNVLQLVNVI
jgi:hypothetical protein